MNTVKRFVLMLVILISGISYCASAQVYIRVRPHRPHYVKVQRPGPHHVWIEDDWAPNGTSYEFRGGRWAEPPRPGAVWVNGHWNHHHKGYVWVEGRWR